MFKLGTQMRNDGFHLHIMFFHDQVQNGRLAAILLLKCVPNHFSDMQGLILFKLGRSAVHDGVHVHLPLFCDLIKDGRLVDWWPF